MPHRLQCVVLQVPALDLCAPRVEKVSECCESSDLSCRMCHASRGSGVPATVDLGLAHAWTATTSRRCWSRGHDKALVLSGFRYGTTEDGGWNGSDCEGQSACASELLLMPKMFWDLRTSPKGLNHTKSRPDRNTAASHDH